MAAGLSLNKVIDLVAAGFPPGVFLDIGANKGVFSLYAARKGLEVHAFEPHPHYVSLLRRAFTISNMARIFTRTTGRLRLHAIALSDADGIVTLHHHDALEGSHSIIQGKVEEDDAIGGRTGVRRMSWDVPTKSLDAFLSRLENRELAQRIRLIKIDVEGAEANVIRGGMGYIRAWRPNIFTEVRANQHGVAGHTFREIAGLLLPLGYRMYFATCLGADLKPAELRCEYHVTEDSVQLSCNDFLHGDVFFSMDTWNLEQMVEFG